MAAITKTVPLRPVGVLSKAMTAEGKIKDNPGLLWGWSCKTGSGTLHNSADSSGAAVGYVITAETVFFSKPIPFSVELFLDASGSSDLIVVYYE
jgi:hypothetical protein